MLDHVFGELFRTLEKQGYAWRPLSPERTLELRALELRNLTAHGSQAASFTALERCFGLGLKTAPGELEAFGISADRANTLLEIAPAVARYGNYFVPHRHWSGHVCTDYVYLGPESLELIQQWQSQLAVFSGARVLDLGSGSGVLSLELASLALEVLGLECSGQAVQWSQAAARTQGLLNVEFCQARVGTPEADVLLHRRGLWDIVVINPPMAVSIIGEQRPHRDGGVDGTQVPFLFLSLAARYLKPKGHVFCLATNPIVHGHSLFFEQLDRGIWEVRERKRLHDYFNHALYRKERYAERGIQRVELWYLHLIKR